MTTETQAPEGAQLPPLPEPHWPRGYQGAVPSGGYTADQMHAYARAALAAPAPQALPATLTDEMRAVLTNEKCVYGSADELYAALLAAAPQTKEPTNDR